jgi:hypothetical protein
VDVRDGGAGRDREGGRVLAVDRQFPEQLQDEAADLVVDRVLDLALERLGTPDQRTQLVL